MVYNKNNHLAEAVICDGKTTRKVQYTYDADGNLTQEYSPTDRSLTTYSYTVENRLEAVYTGNAYNKTLQMAAAYDGDGNRIYQLNYNPDKDEDFSDYYCTNNNCDYNGTGIQLLAEREISQAEKDLMALIGASGAVRNSQYELIEYINDVNREYAEVLVEQNINGRVDTVYTYGNERISREMFSQTSRAAYYLYDPRGSVSGLTDAEGHLTKTYRYSTNGELTFGGATYENEYTYNGESYNPDIQSQYLRARYYDVTAARFLTEDSYLGNIVQPLTLNRYNYCVSSWLNYRDPSGNAITVVAGLIIGGVAGLVTSFVSEVITYIELGDDYDLTEGILHVANSTVSGAVGGMVFGATGNPALAGMADGGTYGFLDGLAHADSTKSFKENAYNIVMETASCGIAGGVGGFAAGVVGYVPGFSALPEMAQVVITGNAAGMSGGTTARLLKGDSVTIETVLFDGFQGSVNAVIGYGVALGYHQLTTPKVPSGSIWSKAHAVERFNQTHACEGGTEIRNRYGQPVVPTEKTLDMALDPETYANAIADKYGINLRGSGENITIRYNPDLRPGIYGRTTAANPNVIEIGPDALISETELANTIAHELNHARSFLKGGQALEPPAYNSGNALSDYINGGR